MDYVCGNVAVVNEKNSFNALISYVKKYAGKEDKKNA